VPIDCTDANSATTAAASCEAVSSTRPAQSAWAKRLEMIESIVLDDVAKAVNERRWKELLCTLAAPSAREKRKMTRLLRMYETGELNELPSDLRADSNRMTRMLIAIFRRLTKSGKVTIEVAKLAMLSRQSVQSARRAIRDLSDACLLIVNRKRGRKGCFGGTGASEYQLVLNAIVDLALSQGVQPSLFPEAPSHGESAPSHGDSAPSHGESAPSHGESAPSHGESAPSHGESAPSHGESAPSHGDPPNARARARSFDSSFSSSNRGSSSPPSGRTQHIAACLPGWAQIAKRLRAYGVRMIEMTVNGAQTLGWSVDQVEALLEKCESATIEGAQAFPPGLIVNHLIRSDPGSSISVRASSSFKYLARRRSDQLELQKKKLLEIAHEDFRCQVNAFSDEKVMELARRANANIDEATGEEFKPESVKRWRMPELINQLMAENSKR